MIGVVRPTPLSLLPGRLVRGCRLDRSPSGPGRDPVFTDSPQRPRGPLHTAVRTCLRIRVNTGQCVALSTRGRSRGRRLTPRLWRRAAFRKRPTQPGARGPEPEARAAAPRGPCAPPRPAPLGCPGGTRFLSAPLATRASSPASAPWGRRGRNADPPRGASELLGPARLFLLDKRPGSFGLASEET